MNISLDGKYVTAPHMSENYPSNGLRDKNVGKLARNVLQLVGGGLIRSWVNKQSKLPVDVKE